MVRRVAEPEYRDDLVVLGVSMDEDGWEAVKPFLEAKKVQRPGGDRRRSGGGTVRRKKEVTANDVAD